MNIFVSALYISRILRSENIIQFLSSLMGQWQKTERNFFVNFDFIFSLLFICCDLMECFDRKVNSFRKFYSSISRATLKLSWFLIFFIFLFEPLWFIIILIRISNTIWGKQMQKTFFKIDVFANIHIFSLIIQIYRIQIL